MIEIKPGIFQYENKNLSIKLSKEFFEKESILKTIHEYSKWFTINMKPIKDNMVLISFNEKKDIPYNSDLIDEFSNKVVDYQIQRDLDKESGQIRDIIVDYAYSAIKKKVNFEVKLKESYSFFPFHFKKYSQKEVLLVNIAGEHFFININDFSKLISYQLKKSSNVYKTLKSKFFIYDNKNECLSGIELLSNQIRSKQRYLLDFTSLQMVEITNYCNLKCNYCHASTVSLEEKSLKNTDKLRKDILDNTINIIFQSPSNSIKIELQGGEPLVNWENSKYLIEQAHIKSLEFPEKNTEIILCTNLLLIDEEKLSVLKKYNVQISTSLDGTQELHDAQRVTHSGNGSYDLFIEKLQLTRKVLGHDSVGALLTVSKSNLYNLKEVIDEYVRLGFTGVFIRALNPYGMATKNLDSLGYSVEEFIAEYKKILNYIIELNLKGIYFVDYYSSLLMNRILTPFSTGFMDLQSPAGAGISGVIYDFNGDVYPTDEARMLARVGNTQFKLGNVFTNTYNDIFTNSLLIDITKNSILQTTPSCANCIYNAYCGSDPIRNFVESGNVVGHKPTSDFCHKNKLLFDYLFEILKDNNNDILDVFWSWLSKKNLGEIRI
jgi:His-Xaa-Ser system radical SAM maturase HxsB/His-Xaa-Ser system protein HxsD